MNKTTLIYPTQEKEKDKLDKKNLSLLNTLPIIFLCFQLHIDFFDKSSVLVVTLFHFISDNVSISISQDIIAITLNALLTSVIIISIGFLLAKIIQYCIHNKNFELQIDKNGLRKSYQFFSLPPFVIEAKNNNNLEILQIIGTENTNIFSGFYKTMVFSDAYTSFVIVDKTTPNTPLLTFSSHLYNLGDKDVFISDLQCFYPVKKAEAQKFGKAFDEENKDLGKNLGYASYLSILFCLLCFYIFPMDNYQTLDFGIFYLVLILIGIFLFIGCFHWINEKSYLIPFYVFIAGFFTFSGSLLFANGFLYFSPNIGTQTEVTFNLNKDFKEKSTDHVQWIQVDNLDNIIYCKPYRNHNNSKTISAIKVMTMLRVKRTELCEAEFYE